MAFQEQLKLLQSLLESEDVDQKESIVKNSNSLRSVIITSSADDLVQAIEQLGIDLIERVLDKALQTQDDQFRDNLLDIFSLFLRKLPFTYIVQQFDANIDKWMQSDCEQLKQMWLSVLVDHVGKEVRLDYFIRPHSLAKLGSQNMLQAIVATLGESSQSLAKQSHQILIRLAKSDGQTVSELFTPSLLSTWERLKGKNEVVRLRVYDLMIAFGNLNETIFHMNEIERNLQQLMQEIRSPDPLVSLNCVHLLNDLVCSAHGAKFLRDSGYFDVISKCILDAESVEFGHLLLPTYLRTFALMAKQFPQLLLERQDIITRLIDQLNCSDQSIVSSALDSIAIIGHGSVGKIHLDQVPAFRNRALPTLAHLLASGSDLSDRAIACVASLLEIDDLEATTQASALVEQWFKSFSKQDGQSTASKIIFLCRQPFKAVRLESFNLLRILCTHPWGQKELQAESNFIEYILNRSTESEKEEKEAKFAVVRELVISPYTLANFGRTNFSRLKRFYNDGPLHIDTDVSVAVKSGN